MLILPEPSSPGSSAHCEDETPPFDTPHTVMQLSDAIPVTYPPLTRAEEYLDIVDSSQGIIKFKKWLNMRTRQKNKDPSLHKPSQVPRKPRRPADRQSPSQSPARVNATNEGPSWMAATRRVPVSTLPCLTIRCGMSNISF